jgi:RNA polymerase sigma factor (sigma-70 family)
MEKFPVGFCEVRLFNSEMQAKSDVQLLRQYTVEKSESAFGEVVHRHADLVYSAAWRQVGSPDLAGEIAQRVFIDLAHKARSLAGSLREDASLAGWLFRATRYAALNLMREERRRHAREREVMQEIPSASEAAPDWNSVAPLLDEAISALDEQERDALLLRYFKNQDFRAVGAALGVSDDTAQKRVARSLEKLRANLQRRGVTTTTAALSTALASHAVQTVPAGLAAAWITASLAKAAMKGGATFTLLKLMSMTKIQLGLGAIVIGGLAITVANQHQTENKMREENQALRVQLAGLAADTESLSNRLVQVSAASPPVDDKFRELLRLRGEVGMLRQQTNLVGKLQAEIRHLQASTGITTNQSVEEAKFRGGRVAMVNSAKILVIAIGTYMNANNNVYPTNFAQLDLRDLPRAIPLDTFEMVNVGKVIDPSPWTIVLREKTPQLSPNGEWSRMYGLSDGSVQEAIPEDGNFEAWEQNWEQNHTGPTSAGSH